MKRWTLASIALCTLLIVGRMGYETWVPSAAAPAVAKAPIAAQTPSAPETPSSPAQATPPAQQQPTPPAPQPPKKVYLPSDPPDPPAKVALDAIALNLRNFGHRFGGNPVGSNPEITKTLNGGNPAKARYLPPEHTNISPAGELLDHWGTPYFFHQQSAFETVIRSAGPDRKLHTVDDITAK